MFQIVHSFTLLETRPFIRFIWYGFLCSGEGTSKCLFARSLVFLGTGTRLTTVVVLLAFAC